MHYERFNMQNFNFFDCIFLYKKNNKCPMESWILSRKKNCVMYEGVPRSRDGIRTKQLLNFWSKRGAGCIPDHFWVGAFQSILKGFWKYKFSKESDIQILVGWAHSNRQLCSTATFYQKWCFKNQVKFTETNFRLKKYFFLSLNIFNWMIYHKEKWRQKQQTPLLYFWRKVR